MKDHKRRSFLKKLLLGGVALPVSLKNQTLITKKQASRIKKGDMIYRRLGKTDLMISEISLGGSPLPEWALLLQLIERGVNYIDTSYSYMNGNSERRIGQLFRTIGRNQVQVGTKFRLRGSWDTDSIIRSVENSLDRLQTDFIDVLLIHGADNPEHLTDPQVLKAFDIMKNQGKFRYKGLSCHANHQEVIDAAIDCGQYDMIQLGYNVFDLQVNDKPVKPYNDYLGQSGLRRLIRKANSKGMGVIAMKALKHGGKLQNLSEYSSENSSLCQSMLKWVLDNPNISSVTTEILTFDQMEEDLAVPGAVLSREERKNLYALVAKNGRNYCHMCGSCTGKCPAEIPITDILRYLMYAESQEKTTHARNSYLRVPFSKRPSQCRDCGACELACIYGVRIRKQLRKAVQLLA